MTRESMEERKVEGNRNPAVLSSVLAAALVGAGLWAAFAFKGTTRPDEQDVTTSADGRTSPVPMEVIAKRYDTLAKETRAAHATYDPVGGRVQNNRNTWRENWKNRDLGAFKAETGSILSCMARVHDRAKEIESLHSRIDDGGDPDRRNRQLAQLRETPAARALSDYTVLLMGVCAENLDLAAQRTKELGTQGFVPKTKIDALQALADQLKLVAKSTGTTHVPYNDVQQAQRMLSEL